MIIIDAWNLIRNERSAVDDTDCDSLDSARALVRRLIVFQQGRVDPIVLVFDSTNEYLGMEYASTPRLKIVAAKDADDYIKRFIDGVPERQRPNLRVVSSDNGIYYYAKDSRAAAVKSEDFWGKLKRREHVQSRGR